MRIIAILFLFVMLAAIVSTMVFIGAATARRDIKANASAKWRACSISAGSMTTIEIHLETSDHHVLQVRSVVSIFNNDENYDKLYLDGMEDARNRAFLLNSEEG